MLTKFKTVYVLAPHTDDGELGAGGTINKLIEKGADVYYFAFSTAETPIYEGFPKDILKIELINTTSKLDKDKINNNLKQLKMIYNWEQQEKVLLDVYRGLNFA